jgi:predicted ribosome-associated RNA-binding protein Tma20
MEKNGEGGDWQISGEKKIPEEQLREILEKVRELRRKKKKQSSTEALKEEEAYLCNRWPLAFNARYRYIVLWSVFIRTENSDTNYYCLFHNWRTASCTMVIC